MVSVQRPVHRHERSAIAGGAEEDLLPEVADHHQMVVESDHGEDVEGRREHGIVEGPFVEPPDQQVDVLPRCELDRGRPVAVGVTAGHVPSRYRLESTAHLPPQPQEPMCPSHPIATLRSRYTPIPTVSCRRSGCPLISVIPK